MLGDADVGIGEAVAAEDVAGVPQADTTSIAVISGNAVTLIYEILRPP
jgi:hypothetical protein